MLSFRTTAVECEPDFAEYDRGDRLSGKPVILEGTLARDTHVGTVLRRFSLHKLPQLINVLRGEMSLIGPCPLSIAQSDRLRAKDPDEYLCRFDVKPGVIDAWQVFRPVDRP